MKKGMKIVGIVVLLFLGGISVMAFLGKGETLELNINPVNLAQIPNGIYTGVYDCYRWSNTVMVTVADHRITQILLKKGPDGREKLSNSLIEKVLAEQRVDVDGITGATASSKAFLKAIENALSKQ